MSENQNRNVRDFSKYDAMDTQELEAILRLDSEAPQEQESDTELILYVMEVLASRKNASSTGKTALEAWESFQKNYLPDEEDRLDHTSQTEKPVKTASPWLRRLAAAAAVIALLVGGFSITTSAFGWEDIWNAVAKWAKETFSFVRDTEVTLTEPDEQNVQEYASLQEALEASGLNDNFIPTWIPDGYELIDITSDQTPMQSIYIAQYKCGEKELIIAVRSYLGLDPEKIEINDELIEIYEIKGVEYYIFLNNQQICAAWTKDSYECRISGELTVEEIKSMIDSIGKE